MYVCIIYIYNIYIYIYIDVGQISEPYFSHFDLTHTMHPTSTAPRQDLSLEPSSGCLIGGSMWQL